MTSGTPNFVLLEATTKSHASTISQPPANAKPSTAFGDKGRVGRAGRWEKRSGAMDGWGGERVRQGGKQEEEKGTMGKYRCVQGASTRAKERRILEP